MTGRTHDLFAFTALAFVIANNPPQHVTLATALVALSANFIGGLAPDIDQPTADLWRRIPAGGIIGRLFTPFLGGHRFISHSILGVFVFGLITHTILNISKSVVLVDMNLVWNAFMIGFISHLVIDMLTKEGVPWLFPIPFHFGFPPFRFIRLKTGEFVEKTCIFPGLLVWNVYFFYTHYTTFLHVIKNISR